MCYRVVQLCIELNEDAHRENCHLLDSNSSEYCLSSLRQIRRQRATCCVQTAVCCDLQREACCASACSLFHLNSSVLPVLAAQIKKAKGGVLDNFAFYTALRTHEMRTRLKCKCSHSSISHRGFPLSNAP